MTILALPLSAVLLVPSFPAPSVPPQAVPAQAPSPRPVSEFSGVPLTGGVVVRLDPPREVGSAFTIRVPTSTARPNAAVEELELSLVPISLRSDDFHLVEYRADGSYVEVDPGPERTYTGVVPGLDGTRVAASVLENGLFAAVFLPDGSRRWIEPLSEFLPSADRALHVVYGSEDTTCQGVCGTDEKPQKRGAEGESSLGGCGGGMCIAQLATDADFEYYTAHGSNTVQVQNAIASVVNVLNHQYQTQIDNLTHTLTTMIVRTAEPDPYSSTNSSTLLTSFRNYWNANHAGVARDLAHLFTGKNLDGGVIGIAQVGVVCSLSNAYGLVQSDFTASFACKSDLSAHEIGHNWNASHCTCPSSTMNPSITCANTFLGSGSSSVSQIDGFRDGRACLSAGGIPPANDLCENATVVTTSTTIFANNTGANADGATNCGFPGGGGRDLYWRLVPPAQGLVYVDTCGSSIDTILSVHTACPARVQNTLNCNDDNTCSCPNPTSSCTSFSVNPGENYWIRVAGANGATGAIQLNISIPGVIPFCPGDGTVGGCPCGNEGTTGRGCDNSIATGGALLTADGEPGLVFDTLVMTSSGERADSLTIFMQGTDMVSPLIFGDGLRCVGGTLKRLYTKTASGGVVTAPTGADPTISARSAALGDPIASGEERFYLAYYRDGTAGFCPPPQGSTFNASQGLRVRWE